MIKLEKTEVWGFKHAVRGMRNPLNSWDKSDSTECTLVDKKCGVCESNHEGRCYDGFIIGNNDLNLMKKLRSTGSDHGKFMRMIMVSVDINAPLYWWKEFDTYKVGTVANSCSTMHKIHSKPIELSDFSIDNFVIEDNDLELELNDYFYNVVADCEVLRKKFIETKDKKYWRGLIQLLPTSYNQLRTVTLNYEVLRNIYHARKNHKLNEWHEFCDWVESLPYAESLIIGEE